MAQLRLTVNPQKTVTCPVARDSFNLVGYTFGSCHRVVTGGSLQKSFPAVI